MTSSQRVFVVGVGMTPFLKPGKHDQDYPDFAGLAALRALRDAGPAIDRSDLEQIFCGYVYGDSTSGQRAIYSSVGLTGIPIVNVNNNCSTGTSALYLARQAIKGGQCGCALVLGFEKMAPGSIGLQSSDGRANPLDQHMVAMMSAGYPFSRPDGSIPPGAPWLFGNAAREHMQRFGTTKEQFALIAVKNSGHSVNNPYSQFRHPRTLAEVMSSPEVYDPLTKLQCCPTSDGAAAAVLVSEQKLQQLPTYLQNQAVEITGQALTTDTPGTLASGSAIRVVGGDMTRLAAQQVYKEARISPADIDVVELHDCFTANELITYEGLGLCPEGKGGLASQEGQFTYGGKGPVVNPSGGLISKGHPLGATGLAQCCELVWQLRGQAARRQVAGAKVGLQHNLGLGGACVVTAYRKYNECEPELSLVR